MTNDIAEAPATEAPIEDDAIAQATAAASEQGAGETPASKQPEPVKKSCSPGLTGWMTRSRV